MRRRYGFTLIELLVVIAIIGILAAMLFPVFARARESARKTQCLANVKNLAIAVNMYLVDWDAFPGGNTDKTQIAYWQTIWECVCEARLADANPYLKWPVVLDDYVKNRDVWKCPSARATIDLTILGGDNWFERMRDATESDVCPRPGPGSGLFPPGWGGTVTDTLTQGWNGCPTAGEDGAFIQHYGHTRGAIGMKTSAMNDPAKYVAIAEAGRTLTFDRTSWIAYPDICRIDSIACADWCGADWEGCSWSQDCGALKGEIRYNTDVQYRKEHAWPRHLGGSNIGFADGHAKWFNSEAILFGGENWNGMGNDSGMLEGVGVCFNPTTKNVWE